MPKPLTHEQYLAEFTLERLAQGLEENAGQTGEQLAQAQIVDLTMALQRLMGALTGEAYEERLLALLTTAGVDCGDTPYRLGDAARSIAEARACAARDVAEAAA